MNKIDAIIAAAIGEITALFFYYFLGNAQNEATGAYLLPNPIRAWLWLMMPIFPILAPICLWVASLIGKKMISVFQLAKFLLVGAMATVFDLGSLGIFMAMTGIKEGVWYVIFKSASFIISVALKYFPDKFWAFKKTEAINKKKEFLQFFSVTFASFVVNVGVAGAVNNLIGPQFAIDKSTWGIIAGMFGVIVAFAINFIGYKFFVFKK